MSVIAFFFLLTLQPHGYGQPTGASQTPWTRGKAWEARELLVDRTKRSFPDDDDDSDYEIYQTPTPELMHRVNLTTLSLVTAQGTHQGSTSVPVSVDLVKSEPTTHETTKGKLATEELTMEATDRSTMNPTVPTSGLPSTGQQTTHDLTTEKVVTDVPEIVVSTTVESTSKATSPGQQFIHNSTAGDVSTDTMAISTTGKSATDPSATVTLALDTDKAETLTPTVGQLVTDSATTREPPTSLPGELKPNHSSPASSLNDSALFFTTVHPLHNFSTTFSPPSSSDARSDPPKPKVATGQIGLSNTTALVVMATTTHLLFSDQIPVRQCLLAVLVLAVIATIFLICTVVLAVRLSRKGHTYPVRDYSPTEMVCISSLMAEGEAPPMANGGPVSAKTQLLKPTQGPGDDCDGDDLTLHSFLP
ncbi:P-selectin glycoprotein ligand 1 [Vombatus ursinus]|uniref:Selectin P ligand n=1 Tax=Vombatus ursinus TaxID=29139 RepID=A0A4X2KBJ4_VOMUR|nr:P-selectin glycoprotein ligand 1 [Vombatus ursinus]XP_027720541.1 P-selectin glycoprotein ligand 1 [Vombatus ursinus]